MTEAQIFGALLALLVALTMGIFGLLVRGIWLLGTMRADLDSIKTSSSRAHARLDQLMVLLAGHDPPSSHRRKQRAGDSSSEQS